MSDAMAIFYGDEKVGTQEEIHETVMEHIIASEYGWTLEYIRNLSYKDFHRHFSVCFMKSKADFQKFKAIAQIQGTKGIL